MTRLYNVRVGALALALAASLLGSTLAHAQSSLIVARGSLRGWLLTWTPFTGNSLNALQGDAADAARFGTIHVVSQGEEYRGTFFNDQQTLYGASADERSLRFSAETFWMGTDEASSLLAQFSGGAHESVQQSAELWSSAPSSIFDTRGGDGPRASANTSDSENRPDASGAPGPWIGSDETPALVTDEPSVGPLLRAAPESFGAQLMLTNEISVPAAALETTVPEPATYLLVASGLVIIAVMGRRRTRSLAHVKS